MRQNFSWQNQRRIKFISKIVLQKIKFKAVMLDEWGWGGLKDTINVVVEI